MGLITRALARRSSVAVEKAHKTSPANLPPYSQVGVAWAVDAKVGKTNVDLYRNWARHDTWIRAAIDMRRRQVSSADWDIVPFDNTHNHSERLRRRIKEMFNTPNPRNDSFRSFIEPLIEDLLVLDAGVIEKDRNLMDELVYLWPVDGATIRVSATWDGSDPKSPRYFWYPGWEQLASFRNEDMTYIMANPVNYLPVGISPLETLKTIIEADLRATDYNMRQVSGAAPDGLFDLGENATRDDVRQYASYFMSEVTGKGAVGFIGGTKGAKFIPVRQSNRDMQFLEWQTYLVRQIAAVFGMSPQDLGLTMDVNRANSEVQQQNTEDRGLRPLMALLQDYLTEEIVWDRSFGGAANNLCFRFTSLNLRESMNRANMAKLAGAGVPWQTVNDIRLSMGYSPVGDPNDENNPYNKLIMALPQGAATLDDIPSVRELVMLMHPTGTAPQGGAGATETPEKPPQDSGATKALSEAVVALVGAHNEQVSITRAADTEREDSATERLEAIVKALAERPINVTAPTTIAEGAVQLTVEAPQVHIPPEPVVPPRKVVRETRFEMDERGVITGKHEVEEEA